MLTLVLFAQLAAAVPHDTATYSSPALRNLIGQAVLVNNRVPASLGSYRATLESEISIGTRDGGGHEVEASIEQVASELAWSRTGDFEQHVTGYRSRQLGFQFATIGFFRNAWVVPSLYGNRLSLLFGVDTTRRRGMPASATVRGNGTNSNSTLIAVHPLSVDRERLYRFAGGDTVEHLKIGDRDIRIVRIEVTPKEKLPFRTVVFSGELDLDVDRKHVVRMRGSFASTAEGPSGTLAGILSSTKLSGIAFVELVNSEVNQEYWLPSYQRFEAQAMLPVMGDAKAVFRIVSRFHDYVITPPDPSQTIAGAMGDSLQARPHKLSVAARDSLSAFRAWREELGAATQSTNSEDFMDVAPAHWRADGPPQVMLQTERLGDLVRFNRIEGLFTGLGVGVRMRDAAPGLTLRVVGGYAWNERTVRARASAVLARGSWSYAVRAGRSLDITNDFRDPLDSGSTLGALFGTDDYDYVDRYGAGASATHSFAGGVQARLEAGWTDDRAATNALSRNLFKTSYLANRSVDEGSYLRSAFMLSWNANVSAEYMGSGFGAVVSYVRGDGQLNFQRVDLRVNSRHSAGRWTFATRFDAGVLLGSPPPQQLFELGNTEGLPGYRYKEFAGDQAVALRTLALYRLNMLNAPIRLTPRVWLPAIAPELAASLQSGWTGASDPAARASILRLGTTGGVPVSTITGNARATVSGGIRFFGGSLGISMARAVDRADKWKARLNFGQVF